MEELILGIAREAIITALKLASPMLILSLTVGLLVSIFQATTQIQEPTLTFVPKIFAVFMGVFVFGSWMLDIIVGFTIHLFENIANFI